MRCARYLRYSPSFRDVEELLNERGLEADHTTIWRWVQRYGPELEPRLRRHLKPTNKSWRVDEALVHDSKLTVNDPNPESVYLTGKLTSGYRRQGRVENTFFRYTAIIGDGLRARSPAGQGSEAVLGCEILNRMTALGRPVSYHIDNRPSERQPR